MTIKRDLMNRIRPFLEREEFIAIVGPRQSGKTTFLQMLKSQLCKALKINKNLIQTVTFEDRMLLSQFEDDPVSFISSYVPPDASGRLYLMIDEFQYAVDGGQKLKLIYDTVKDVKIFITGSSSLDIKAHVGKYMVGRILRFDLQPFSFREYLRAHDKRLERIYSQNNEQFVHRIFEEKKVTIKSGFDTFSSEMIKHYEKYCIWGGYPAVVLAKDTAIRKKLLSELYNNYILKDIKTLLELATERNLFLLSQHLATQIGNIVIYQNLGQASKLNYRQLKKHLAILEETYVCKEVRPFFKNRQKELSKNPKIFFMDMGFRNNLMENMNTLAMRPDAGAMIENAVFIRLHEVCGGFHKINFWRTKAGAEVDFIIPIKGKVLPIEVKYSSYKAVKISRSLSSFIDTFKPEQAVVLTKDYWGSMKREKTKILFIPVYYL
jgi:predicted AAA+ superfamily ATPase